MRGNIVIDIDKLKKQNIIAFAELLKKKGWQKAVLVFTPNSFPPDTDYSELDRSYVIESSSGWLTQPEKPDNVLYGVSLRKYLDGITDEREETLNLSYYLSREERPWKIAFCYILN